MFGERSAPVQRSLLAMLVWMVLLTSTSAASGEADQALAEGRRLFLSFEYEEALEQLETVVNDDSANAAQRVEALEIMGVLHYNLNRQPQARQMFEQLLNVDPGHVLTDTSYPPRLISFYTTIQESFIPQLSLDIEVDAFEEPPGSGDLLIEATMVGAVGSVAQAVALVRASGEVSFRRALMSRDGDDFSAEIPSQTGAGDFEFYVEAEAPSGYVLAHAGSADAPLQTSSSDTGLEEADLQEDGEGDGSPETGRRWYRSWWFWTIVGVAIAGGTATAIVLTLPEEQEEGTLGTRSLP